MKLVLASQVFMIKEIVDSVVDLVQKSKDEINISIINEAYVGLAENKEMSDRYFMKFIEEVGELSECIRKDRRIVNNDIKGNIEEELYDVLYYIICLANTYDIDLQNSIFLKEALNSKKYKRKSICDDF